MIAFKQSAVRPAPFALANWPQLEPLRVLPLLSVVLLLTSMPPQWYLRGPLVALFALGVAFQSWLTRPQFWYAAATLLGTTVYLNWETADNHKYLFVYWCLALCCALSLPRPQQPAALALSSRWLIGLCMLLAVVWKGINPQYLDGTFFEYELLCDQRLAALASRLTSLLPADLAANRELRELVQAGHLRGLDVPSAALASTPAIAWLAWGMTWWTIGIEGLLAGLFLWPDNHRVAKARNGLLLFFAATTYVIAPVRGFGWMLMLLGMAQCREDEHRLRLAYLVMLVVIQIYTLPVGTVMSLVL